MRALEDLKKDFTGIDFREKRPNLFKVIIPFFHEDGDMYDIFIEESPTNRDLIRISDYGLTEMRLSYVLDLDTEHKKEVFQDIVSQNRCSMDNGNIFLDVRPDQFTIGIYQFAQTISKITNMEIISRESLKSYFNELLEQFIFSNLDKYKIRKNTQPTDDVDLTVDYEIPAEKPIYIFGVKDDSKASKVVIACLQFQAACLPYRSLIIHENFDKLSSFNKNQITNIGDKQFTTLNEFEKQGISYIKRELVS